jgi:hypothetical protein
MSSTPKNLILLLCIAMVISLSLATPSFAKSDSSDYGKSDTAAGKMAVDLVVIRPIAIVGSVVGCALYVASLPFSLPGGNSGEVWDTTVKAPVKFAFVRPLGSFPN